MRQHFCQSCGSAAGRDGESFSPKHPRQHFPAIYTAAIDATETFSRLGSLSQHVRPVAKAQTRAAKHPKVRWLFTTITQVLIEKAACASLLGSQVGDLDALPRIPTFEPLESHLLSSLAVIQPSVASIKMLRSIASRLSAEQLWSRHNTANVGIFFSPALSFFEFLSRAYFAPKGSRTLIGPVPFQLLFLLLL